MNEFEEKELYREKIIRLLHKTENEATLRYLYYIIEAYFKTRKII